MVQGMIELPGYVEMPARIEIQIRRDGIPTRMKNSSGEWWVVFRVAEGGPTDTMPEYEWNYTKIEPVTREWDGEQLLYLF